MTAPGAMTQNAQQRLRPFSPMRFGRYTLVARLAQGGMGELFLAQLGSSQDFQKLCVIKRMLPQLAHDPEFVERFTDEARVLVKLSHGSIAQVLELGTHEGSPFLALEYVDGKDLRRVLQRVRELQRPLPLGVSIQVMCRVLEALSYAHRKRDDDGRELQLVHRDISPPNILVSYEGEVKVIDFGLARSRLSAAKTNPRSLLGKFLYMSPEQARHQPVDRRSDLYAVGLCLYELIAGIHPFEGLGPAELMSKVSEPSIPPLGTVAPRCPSGLADVVMRALAVPREQRFQSADELRIALQGHLTAADAGSESVSRAMHALFSSEFQLERRLLSAARAPLQVQQAENRSRDETGIIAVPEGLLDPSVRQRNGAPPSGARGGAEAAAPSRSSTEIIPAPVPNGDAERLPTEGPSGVRSDTEIMPAVTVPAARAESGELPASGPRRRGPPTRPGTPPRGEPSAAGLGFDAPSMRLAPGSGGVLVPAGGAPRAVPPPIPRERAEPLPVVSARAAAATFGAARPPPIPSASAVAAPPSVSTLGASSSAQGPSASPALEPVGTPSRGLSASPPRVPAVPPPPPGDVEAPEPPLAPDAAAALAAWFEEEPEPAAATEAATELPEDALPTPVPQDPAPRPPRPSRERPSPPPAPGQLASGGAGGAPEDEADTPPPPPAEVRAASPAPPMAVGARLAAEPAVTRPVPLPSRPGAEAPIAPPPGEAATARRAQDLGDTMDARRPTMGGEDAFQEAATQQSWVQEEDGEDEERTDPSFRLTAPEPVDPAFRHRRQRTGLWLAVASLILLGLGMGAAVELSQRRQAEEDAARAAAESKEAEAQATAAALARAEAALKADADEEAKPAWQLFVDTEADARILVAPLRIERVARKAEPQQSPVPPGELGIEWQRTSELFERLRADRTCEGALFLLCKRFERVAERVRAARTDDAALRGQVRELRRSLEQLGG